MTLIITAVRGLDVFQVSDRRVTQQTGTATSTWDPAANKAVVVRGTDFAVSMCYTGLAYIGDMPTDQFITQQVIGQRLIVQSAGAFSGEPWLTHLQGTAERLREGLDTAYGKLVRPDWRATGLQVVIGGIQRRTPRDARLIWVVSKANAATPCEIVKLDIDEVRDLGTLRYDGSYRFAIAGDVAHTSHAELESVLGPIAHQGWEPFLEAMIEYVRTVGRRTPTVGQDVMSVLFGGSCDEILIRYTPNPAAAGVPNPAYTPWTITSRSLTAPSVIQGHTSGAAWGVGQGDAEIRFTYEGPTYPPELVTVIQRINAQTRPSPPA